MPLDAPFKACFTDGDLVYGLAFERDRYLRTSDAFANARSHYVGAKTALDDALFDALDGMSLNEVRISVVPVFIDQFVLPYELAGLAVNTWAPVTSINPSNLYEDFILYLTNHEVTTFRSLAASELPADYPREKLAGRKCKMGLSWMAERNRHVHFVLDFLKMPSVITKTSVLGRSCTAKELRWIYRNRHKPSVRRCVQFWEKNRPVCPPWESDAVSWENYQPKNVWPEGVFSQIFNPA